MKHYTSDNWREGAYCLGIDPNVFFAKTELEQQEIAAKFCGHCTVRQFCLDYALTTRQDDGVWGGTTEIERREILGLRIDRRRRKAT